MIDFGRLITAMITPFTAEGEVDYDESVRIAEHLVATGTDTVLLAGTTGESPTLTHDEELQLFKEVTAALKGKAKVMAGTGSNCTKTAVSMTLAAQRIGVDAVLQVVPYYNKPSQEGLIAHFTAVAESSSLPIMLYNIPGRTGTNMEPETIASLSKKETIFSVKEAAGSVEQVKAIKSLIPDDFLIYSGDDGLTLDFMNEGAHGVVSVASHCAGTRIRSMLDAHIKGDLETARSIHTELESLFKVLFITSNPAPVKAAMELMGFNSGSVRLPLVPPNTNQLASIADVLNTLQIL